jgi:hypothetical protein
VSDQQGSKTFSLTAYAVERFLGENSLLRSIVAASLVALVSWASLNAALKGENWHWLIVPGVVFAMPGCIFAEIVAAIFSPKGFHGIEDFVWVVAPANLMIYFVLFLWLFRRRVAHSSTPSS